MFLSLLHIDVGDNPDRPRPGRLWLRNLYHVHQRLCMAFPSDSRRNVDPQFLAPYRPDDFPEQRHLADQPAHAVDQAVLKDVHAPRGANRGFLFRIDPLPGGRVVILVQSAVKPDWDYAFRNAGYLLAAPPEVKPFHPCFTQGQRLRFRLVANPTKRFSKNSREKDGQPVKERWVGKRVPVPTDNDKLVEWLDRRAGPAGFSIVKDSVTVQRAYIYFNKPTKDRDDESEEKRNDKGHRLRSVRYDGILEVTDPARFRETLVRGIGPGKAFGFGLLSIAPGHPSLSAEAT